MVRLTVRGSWQAAWVVAVALVAGCGGGPPSTTPVQPTGLGRAQVDSIWTRAMREYTHGRWGKAITLFERITFEVPANDTLAIEARFRVAECHFALKNQLEAAREFRKVSDETPTATLAPLALLRAGDAYADLWRRPELDPTYGQTALATYQEMLSRYPDSPVAPRARLRIARLEEKFARKQFKTAMYYHRLKAYDSAILYLKDLVATYPRASVTPEALIRLAQAYRALGYEEDLAETCAYIRRFHPDTPELEKYCPAPPVDAPPPAAPADST